MNLCSNFWPWADCIRMFSQPGVLISAMVFLSSCFDSFSILVNCCCGCCCCFTRGSLEDLPDKLSPCHSTNAPSHNTSERVHLLLDQVFQIALSHTSYWHGKSHSECACMLGGGTDYSFTSKWYCHTIVLLPNEIAVLWFYFQMR
jgi:hypothetical protein